MGAVIDDAVARLGVQVHARVPERTAVDHAEVALTPTAVSTPDSAVAIADASLVDYLEGRAVAA